MKSIEVVSKEVSSIYGQALKDGDIEAIVSLYSEDATLMPPDENSVSGISAIREYYSGLMESGFHGMSSRLLSIEEAPDFAYEAVEFTLYSNPDESMSEDQNGKHILIWKRVNGAWKVHFDIWNMSP